MTGIISTDAYTLDTRNRLATELAAGRAVGLLALSHFDSKRLLTAETHGLYQINLLPAI